MASTIFQSAQRIISQVLQWLQSSNQAKTNNLITDSFQPGIDNSTTLIGEGFHIVPGTNNTAINPSVNITGGGIAYDPTGARVFIDPSDVTFYNPTAPSDTTNDGLGNFISTAQSTGVINIPVTQSSNNYIWINYLATIDTTAFTLNKETNAKQFYKQTDGYNIQVTVVNVPPNANSIFLGSVTTTGIAVQSSNISQMGRSYFSVLPNIVPIVTPLADNSDRSPSYAPATRYNLETHIKAVGTGSGISPTNPHNMSLADLGVGVLDTVQEHRILEHGNGIIAGVPGTPYPTTSAMATSINIVNPGSDTLNVFALLSTEFAIINGTAYNTNAIFGIVPTNATVNFPDVSGTYNVYWDSASKVFLVTTGDLSADITKLWIATVTYTFVGHGVLDHNSLSVLIDRRRVGSTTHLLQRWTNNSRPGVSGSFQPESGEFGFNLTTGVMEYWNGSTWIQPPAGVDNITIDLNGSSQVEVKNAGITTSKIASGAVTTLANNGTGSHTDYSFLVTTQSITTTGGPVLVLAHATALVTTNPSGEELRMAVTRGGTVFNGNNSLVFVGQSLTNVAASLVVMTIDTPASGTYIYNLTMEIATPGGTINSVPLSALVLLELKR